MIKIKKRLLLSIIKNIEKKEPKKLTTINVFNTGFIIDNKQLKSIVLKLAKEYINKNM